MSLIEHKSSDLSDDVEDGASHTEQVDGIQSDTIIEGGRSDESQAGERIDTETETADSANTVLDEEPGAVAGINGQTSTTSSPSPSTTTPVASRSASCTQETQTTGTSTKTSTSITPFVGPVQGPVINVYSPYIEDQRMTPPGPNVFEKNIRNAIESRKQEEKSGSHNQDNDKGPDGTPLMVQTDPSPNESVILVTPSNSVVLETDSNREHDETSTVAHGKTEQTDTKIEEQGDQDQDDILPEGRSNKEGNELSIDGNMKQDGISMKALGDKEKAENIAVEPSNKEEAQTPVEAQSTKEAANTPVETNCTNEQVETTTPNEVNPETEHPREVDTQTENFDAQTQPSDAETLAQAKEWHDSIVRRVARLRGLSSWLGERNKRMDGMVEILVRSLEHMGVGAVTDHIGNLIPLQNFRLNSAIKLSSTDNTWMTCDDEIISNDINAWLPESLPGDHNLSLTNEQMRKYESQVEVLRAENESLQRSLQTALDNQGSLGVQINQWQACIDSAGQQLCRVTQEVHESKSRERHLRHLLGEERRIKDSLVQQNSVTKAEQQDQTTENVNCWPQSNDRLSGLSQSATSATTAENGITFVQAVAADRQHLVGNVAFNSYTGSPSAQTTAKASPVTERPWQHRIDLSPGLRSTRSSRLNSSAPPFVSAYSSPHRQNYQGNWHAGSEWHSRSGSGRNFGSAIGRGRHNSGRGFYRNEHSTHAGINRLLDGFFDNLNRIENALRQQGISVPGPSSDASQVVRQQQQQQQIVSSNVNMQYPTVHELQQQQQQTAPNQPIYYNPSMQPVVYAEPESTVAQPVLSVPSMQQVPHQSPTVVHQAIQPHVQFAQVEEQVY